MKIPKLKIFHLGFLVAWGWATVGFCAALNFIVFPSIVKSRVALAESIINSQREALILNDSRATRDAFVRQKIIETDSDFDELRSERSLNLNSCRFISMQTCLTSNGAVILSETRNLLDAPSFEVGIKTKYFKQVHGFTELEILLVLLQSSLLGILFLATRNQARERAQLEQQKLSAEAELGRLAAQVSHDIKSPIGALNAAIDSLSLDDLDTRQLITSATTRISLIAEDLLVKNREILKSGVGNQNVSKLLQILIAQKKAECFENRKVIINSNIQADIYASISVSKFERALSNLINNSLESIQQTGCINIILNETQSEVLITIEDSGKGMSISDIHQLGIRGFSSGKANGSGLGFSYAKSILEECRAKIKVTSKIGSGTKIQIFLPKTNTH